jgi:hypothetical protein
VICKINGFIYESTAFGKGHRKTKSPSNTKLKRKKGGEDRKISHVLKAIKVKSAFSCRTKATVTQEEAKLKSLTNLLSKGEK